MFRTLFRSKARSRGRNRRSAGLERFNRRISFESLESRQLLSITLPTVGNQTVLAGAPLNLALNGSESSGDALSYTVSVSNSTLTNGAALTATIPTGNPSLQLTVSDTADGINGSMTFQLFQDLTPKTVEQIMNLVNDGFYNNLTFHRVISGFMIQGGDPNGNGTGGPGYNFDDEFNAALEFTSPGILAMANSGPDTNGSQFFVTVEPYRTGDFRYTIFGLLTSGSTILNEIDAVPVDSNDKPLNTVTITSATLFTDTQNAVLRLSAPTGTTGTADVTVTVKDTVTNETQTLPPFQVTVNPDTNTDRPFLDSISPLTTNANTPLTFNIPATDVDGNGVYYSGIVSPANSNLTINVNSSTGQVTLTPSGGISGVYSIEVGVEAANASSSDSLAWDTQMVPVYVNPAAPSGIQLTAASDTGVSQSDNLTDLNNTSGKTLQFQVGGVVSGSLVQLFSDGTLIGSATASSTATSVTITTNGTATLTDGTHSITATQTLQNQAVSVGNLSTTTNLASPSSANLSITVEASPPQFNFTPVVTAREGVAYACQASASDPYGSVLTYQLSQSPTGMTINANTGLITWTPAVGQAGSSDVIVQATDTAGNVAQKHFTLSVLPANSAPALVPAAPVMGTTDENAPIVINLAGTFINNGDGTTSITDADQNAVVGGIALIGTTGNGTWEYSLDGTTFQPVSTVSDSSALLLPSSAKLRYTPDGQNGETATITYLAWDTTSGTPGGYADLSAAGATGGITAFSTASDTASLTVNSIYDAQVLTPASPSLGSTIPATADTFSLSSFINNGAGTTTITDVTQGAAVGGIALTGASGSGTWTYSLDGTTFTPVGTVSGNSALLLPSTAELRYTPGGTNSETATITYCAWDATSGADGDRVDLTVAGAVGGSTAFSLATDTASLVVNDAPVLDAVNPSMGTTNEDTATTINLTTFINSGAGTTTITDIDGNAVIGGIALIGTTGNGTWAYSLDGTTFTDVGTVSESSALLLPQNAMLQYTPDSMNGETATITYVAWDTTSGTAGGQANLSAANATGGTTAFSTATDTASLTVTSVNDAPVLTAANPSLGSTTVSTADTFALSSFINASGGTAITDVDQGAVIGGIALTGTSGSGTWTYSLDGVTFTAVGAVTGSSALLLPSTAELQYTPNGTTAETATITYCAWDTTTGTAGGTADTTTNGGTTAFSTATDTASLSVINPNTAPVLTAAGPSLGSTLPTAAITFNLVGSFINNGSGTTTITDADSGAVVGGIAVVGVTGKGTWAYSLDGTTYASIGSVSASSALLLPNTAALRYTPDGTDSETATITYCAWDTTSGTSGGTADTTTNGGSTAFSTATDTASLTVAAGSLSGFVYIDAAEDGLHISASGTTSLGIQGIVLTLLQEDSSGDWNTVTSVMTDADGSYSFDNLAAGTYQITKTQPAEFIDGIVTLGTIGGATTGTAGTDEFNLTLTVGGDGSNYNFGEYGLAPGMVSLRMCLASSPSGAQALTQLDTAPVVSLSSSTTGTGCSTTYTPGGSPVAIAAADATVTDADDSMLAWMTATIASRPDGDSETLAATTSGTSITSSYANGVLTLSGVASLADYQQVLTTITYSDTAASPTAGDRTINVVANDGVLSSASATSTVTVASGSAPEGYSITANDSQINASDDTSAGFTFAGATVGDTYNYSVASSGGGTAVTGSGTVSSATQQVTGINVSTLSDGTLTYSVTLTDTAARTGIAATATATLDTTAPSGYSITADDSTIGASQAATTSFTFAGAEVGDTYSYNVTSDGGSGSATGSGTITSATQQVTGVNVSSLPDGTLTYSVALTDAAGKTGAYVAATATLDKTAPAGYTITADQNSINASQDTAASFTFNNAEEFTTYNYTVTSDGGSGSVTGTGTVLSSTQQVTGINVSSLPDGTLTYSVALTDAAGNVGGTVTATATLDKTAPTGYAVSVDQSQIGSGDDAATSFTLTGAELGATYNYTVTSDGNAGGTSVVGSGTITSATQQVTGVNVSSLPDGNLTYSVTLTDAAGNVGSAATATATLDKTAPAGYSITVDQGLIGASQAAAASFTFAGAELGATYNYTVTSDGNAGGTAVVGSGTITSATQQVTGVNVSSLPDGKLTYSVTLTDAAGNVGSAATATTTLDKTPPTGYSIVVDQSQINSLNAAATSFTFTDAEEFTTYNYTVTSDGGSGSVTGSGPVLSSTQQVTGINVLSLPNGTLTYSVTLTDAAGNVGSAATATATLDAALAQTADWLSA